MKSLDIFKNLALIAGVCFLFTACNQDGNKDDDKQQNDNTEQPENPPASPNAPQTPPSK